jgi:hypothetical protein
MKSLAAFNVALLIVAQRDLGLQGVVLNIAQCVCDTHLQGVVLNIAQCYIHLQGVVLNIAQCVIHT